MTRRGALARLQTIGRALMLREITQLPLASTEGPRRADSAGCSATEARSFRVGASGCSYSGPVGMRRFRR